MDNTKLTDRVLKNRVLLRVYVCGLAIVVAIGIGWRLLQEVSPWHSIVDNQIVATVLTVASIVVLPLIVGCIVEFVFRPLTGKWSFWTTIWNIENRLITEIQRDDPKVVLVNWPSESVRSLAVMTSVFQTENTELAAVYIPAGVQGKTGMIRVVPTDEVEVTDWRIRDLQVFQLTYGRLGPDALAEILPGTDTSNATQS